MDYFCNWCKSQRSLEGYTVIVTGCNTGIGKDTCVDLYKRGANIIMACRDVRKASQAKEDIIKQVYFEGHKGSITIEKLDLSSLKSVRECAFSILKREDKINILINNAGVMMCPRDTTEDGFEMQMGTNHFGHALITLLLLPRIIMSAPSKIINLSSVAHNFAKLHFDDINSEKYQYSAAKCYARSKIANILFARALHLKLREHSIENVNTYSVHPGIVRTELSRYYSQTIIPGGTWFYNNIMGIFVKSSQCGAQTTIYCAVDEACDNQSGHYYDDCQIKDPSQQCRDDEEALKFFDLTLKILKLENYNPFGELGPIDTFEANIMKNTFKKSLI